MSFTRKILVGLFAGVAAGLFFFLRTNAENDDYRIHGLIKENDTSVSISNQEIAGDLLCPGDAIIENVPRQELQQYYCCERQEYRQCRQVNP